MRAAFVVVVAEEPGAVPGSVVAMLQAPQPPRGVAFAAEGHLTWTNPNASVRVGAWRGHRPEHGPVTWDVDDGCVAVVTGELRRSGSNWLPSGQWPSLLRPLLADFERERSELAGVFAGLVLDAAGNGYAVTDPFGQRSLFVARCRTHRVVASNAALAAWAVCDEGSRPALDPRAVCGLAYTKHRIGERTGYAGVESLPSGDGARIDSSEGVTTLVNDPPWFPTGDLMAMSDTELIDEAQAAIEEELRAALTFPTELVLVDLTGGKDSRLVLGALLTAGLADKCTFRTDGSPQTPDVVVAKELADLVGVRWIDRTGLSAFYREHLDPALSVPNATDDGTTWTERVRYQVSATTGICNLWHAKALTGNPRAARIGGLTGERIRSSLNFVAEHESALVRRFDRHFGHLDLLLPDALDAYRHEWIDELFSERYGIATLNDRHDTFLFNTLMRANFGPREELTPIHRLIPLASPRAVQASYALRPGGRSAEVMHRTIIGRASPALAEHRFVDGVWQELKAAPDWATPSRRGFRRRRSREGYPPRIDRPVVDVPASAKPATNAAAERRRTEGSSERIALLEEVLSDRGSMAWELIDRDAAAEATARYDQLPRAAQVELMGAATAALWLADGPGR